VIDKPKSTQIYRQISHFHSKLRLRVAPCFMSDLKVGLLCCALVAIVHQVVENNPSICVRPKSKWLHRLGPLYSAGYSLASAVWFVYGCVYVVPVLLSTSFYCSILPPSPEVDTFLFVYFLSKLVEVIDLVSVTARGYPVNLHFRVHHYTTPLFGYVGWMSRSAHGASFALANLLMHVMVYAFHSGFQPPQLKSCLRFWQHVQLSTGILLALAACWRRWNGLACTSVTGWSADLIPPLLFATYYVLFQRELAEEARREKSS
jgi:hypothetical protein